MRFDLAEKIYSLKLLGTDRFFCQTEKEIKLFNLNQVFSYFHTCFFLLIGLFFCYKGPFNIYWGVGTGAFQMLKSMSYLKRKQPKITILSLRRLKQVKVL